MPTEHQPTFDEFAYENLPEGFSSDVTMHTNTVNFINSLVTDEAVATQVYVQNIDLQLEYNDPLL